jgi:hypothetical protein
MVNLGVHDCSIKLANRRGFAAIFTLLIAIGRAVGQQLAAIPMRSRCNPISSESSRATIPWLITSRHDYFHLDDVEDIEDG